MNTSVLMKLAITGGALFAAYKWGPGPVKVAATGALGMLVLNQIPLVRDGLNMRLIADPVATV